ncbi:MAG TPA: glycosyltransferase family 4 protein [Firmicutes bacterium]|nr:glycosyltransferase family 4 protein [Bacillota bacterium]
MKDHVMRLAVGSSARGWRVAIACPRDVYPQDSDSSRYLLEAGVKLIPLSLPGRISPHGDLMAWAGLIRILGRLRPRLVHTHGFKASMVGRMAAATFGVSSGYRPVTICTVHNSIAGQFGSGSRAWNLAKLVEKVLARSTDGVIAVSRALEREYLELSHPSAMLVTCIPNGIALERFISVPPGGGGGVRLPSDVEPPGDAGPPGDVEPPGNAKPPGDLGSPGVLKPGRGPVVGTVARLIPQKGVDVLLRAFPLVREAFPGAELVVAGDGPMRSQLQALAGHLGIGARVAFTGHRNDIPALLRTFDVFVLASLSEGMPVSVIEAMASRVPVVATCTGGIPEVVEDGVSGLLVAPSDPGQLARALIWILSHRDEASRLAQNAFEKVTSRFSIDRMVEDTCLFYQEVFRRKAKQAACES